MRRIQSVVLKPAFVQQNSTDPASPISVLQNCIAQPNRLATGFCNGPRQGTDMKVLSANPYRRPSGNSPTACETALLETKIFCWMDC
jgi:hypothetical protein